jgi:hypothetical protein
MKVDRPELDAVFGMLAQANKDGSLSDDYFHKGLIQLAHEWVMELGDYEEAVSVLIRVPEVYIQYVLPQQMSEDKIFCERALELAQALDEAGLSCLLDVGEDVEEPLRFTTSEVGLA